MKEKVILSHHELELIAESIGVHLTMLAPKEEKTYKLNTLLQKVGKYSNEKATTKG